MASISINKEECKGCGFCVTDCPKGLIGIANAVNAMGYFPAVEKDMSTCTGCGICFVICPMACITVEK
jgi:2-oxoglutarate ferredoxin oxidoreductase subunit delta